MIVMKFGGSSVGSLAAIKRVASIVESQADRHPAVVVSAIGDVTDQLLKILKCARTGESYLTWELINNLRDRHFSLAEELVSAREMDSIARQIRESFRDLQVRMMEACEGERVVTPEESDLTLSLGEQLSSTIVSAAFRRIGLPACHLDSRQLIVTDDQFTRATPRYWETYARLRWALPLASKESVVVLGGFIGATEDGRTTTLGRGGSDLTATIVGAAINADEIQIWKDVDGILTADPRLKPNALLVKNLTYNEAAELAKAGAQILHPETIAPAQRLRIPICLRNTFAPQSEGTSITIKSVKTGLKSIVCKTGITLLAISPAAPELSLTECSDALKKLLAGQDHLAKAIGMSDSVLYLALEATAPHSDLLNRGNFGFQAQLRTDQVIMTLIGDCLDSGDGAIRQAAEIAQRSEGFLVPALPHESTLRLAVPHQHFAKCLASLHELFFAQADPDLFAHCSAQPASIANKPRLSENKTRESRLRLALALVRTT